MYFPRTSKLLIVHNLMWTLPEEKVNLYGWRGTEDSSKDVELFKCGSVACAIGWATATPTFQMLGFEFNHVTDQPKFNNLGGWEAVANFFDISVSEAICLFQAYPYSTDCDIKEEDYRLIVGNVKKEMELSDNVKVMRRIRRYLTNCSDLSMAEVKELKKSEKRTNARFQLSECRG